MERIKRLMKAKVDGIGVVEIILIILVLIVLVILFREKLVALIESLFTKINENAGGVYTP